MTSGENQRRKVLGVGLDEQTRCAHWHGPTDILAIKFRCCGQYYACHDCHDAVAGHPAQRWPAAEFESLALMCGGCGAEQSITNYLVGDAKCLVCGAGFNPRCALHHHFYFETD